MTDHNIRCPHCGNALQAFELPPDTGWQTEFQLACFNDDCPYFVKGWTWMMEQYRVRASYRYRVDPETGHASPLPVWSKTALRDRIVEAEITTGSDPGDHE